MLERLTREDLEPLVDQTFRLSLESGESYEVKLFEVRKVPGTATHREPFSAIFRSPEGQYLPQSIYTLEHEKIGPLDLFLVPLGSEDGGGMDFEAVFT